MAKKDRLDDLSANELNDELYNKFKRCKNALLISGSILLFLSFMAFITLMIICIVNKQFYIWSIAFVFTFMLSCGLLVLGFYYRGIVQTFYETDSD